jgi:hypothetical protein
MLLKNDIQSIIKNLIHVTISLLVIVAYFLFVF